MNKNKKLKKEKYKLSLRGQFFSYDAIVAGVIFSILLTLLFVYWSSIRSFVFVQSDEMFRLGLQISNIILTPGIPDNWYELSSLDQVKMIGITERYGSLKINKEKLNKFYDISVANYTFLKSRLGTGAYEFYIIVNSSGGFTPIEIGVPPTTAKGKTTIVRPVIYNSLPANLSITIWANFTA